MRLGPDSERGATTVDYLGTLLVVAAIVFGISGTAVGGAVADGVHAAICRLAGGDCGGDGGTEAADRPRTDQDYEPKLCNTSTIADKAGAEAKIAWFRWGNEYGFQEQEFTGRDGSRRVLLTFTDATSVGAGASPKPGARLGRLGAEKVELAAGIKVTNGDTWVFDSREEAERLRADLEELKTWETAMKHGGGAGAGGGNWYAASKWADKQQEIEEQLGRKHIGFGKISLDATGDLALKKMVGESGEAGVRLGGKLRVSPEVTVTNNETTDPPTKGYTYQFELEYAGGADFSLGPLTGKAEAGQVRTGTLTVMRYPDGSLARIDITQSVETRGGAKGSAAVERGADKGSGQASDTDRETHVVSNSLEFPLGEESASVAADRRVVENWLDGSGDNTAPFTYLFGDRAPTQRTGADDPFGRLMFEDGVSDHQRFSGTTSAQEYGFEVNLGLSLGAKVSFESSDLRLEEAEYLGAPKPDGSRAYVPYSYCAN